MKGIETPAKSPSSIEPHAGCGGTLRCYFWRIHSGQKWSRDWGYFVDPMGLSNHGTANPGSP
jgi:hypothetical protein